MTQSRFNITAKAGEPTAKITIRGTIGVDWYDEACSEVRTLDQKLAEVDAINAEHVEVEICSLGGSLTEALAIRDRLSQFGDKLTINLIGNNASAATVIAMAAKKRCMSKYGHFLIHKCSSMVYGNENQIKMTLEEQQVFNATMVQIYKDATGINDEEINALMEANNGEGRWLNYSEAEAYGFVTDMIDDAPAVAMVASADIKAYGLPMLPSEMLTDTQASEDRLFARLVNKFNNLLKNTPQNKMQKSENHPLISAVMGDVMMAENGANLTAENLNAIEAALTEKDSTIASCNETINSLTEEKEAANAKVAELEAKVTELSDLLAKVPTADTKVNGTDASDAPKTYADAQKENPFYQGLNN